MIKSFRHKGLEKFYLKGNSTKIHPNHERRLRLILARLEAIHKPEDMRLPGFDFHILRGDKKEYFSVSVNKNWRLIFKFDGTDVYDVDYLDYH
jgi:proteic killer suppression protein